MSKVYVLSSGDYSDWTIEGIFASLEAAQAVLEAEKAGIPADLLPKFRSRFNDYIGDYELGRLGDGAPQLGFMVRIQTSDGAVTCVETKDSAEGSPWCTNSGAVYGYGPTVEHARRSAEEHRRKLATGQGQP